MKKIILYYLVYTALIWIYFIFLYPLETFGSSNYAALSHAMFFSTLPLEIIFLYGLIKTRWAEKSVALIERFTQKESLKTFVYSLFLVLLYALVHLPFQLIWFYLSRNKGISQQLFPDWLYELGLDTLFYWFMITVGLWIARIAMAKFKRSWWLVLWLIALPIAIFAIYVQPVWIDPLYEDFTLMEDGSLRSAIEEVTAEHGLEDADIYKVNMSEKTSTFNAYVIGLFNNARIVLWDTTLTGLEQNEMLFILSHEIGHYVNHHVYIGVAGYIILSFFLLYGASFVYKLYWNNKKPFKRMNDLRAMPVLLLIFSVLLLLAQPVSLYVSRQMELSADQYAIEHTKQLKPAVSSFHKLGNQSKNDIDPAWWIKWIRSSHPSMEKRIGLVKEEIQKRND